MVLISYDIIDCHAHITASGKWFNTPFEASYEILKKNMDLIGIQKTILIPFTSISREDLFFCLEIAKKEPDKFAVAPQIELQDIDLLEGYEKYIVGLKVHPRFNNSKPDSPAIYQLLDHASDIEKPVIFCTYLHSTSVPLRYLEPFVYDELAKKYPDVVFVLAHSCWPRLLDAYIVAKSNQNVYLDLSYFGNLAFGTNLFHDFCLLLDKLDQKVIFGTDFPEVNIDEYTNLWRKKLNHLSQDKIHRIFAGNAKQVFNI